MDHKKMLLKVSIWKSNFLRCTPLSNPIVDFTGEQWFTILSNQKNRCAMCHKQTKLTIDHIIPISRGGNHTMTNIQALCRPCNSKKWKNLPEDKIIRQKISYTMENVIAKGINKGLCYREIAASAIYYARLLQGLNPMKKEPLS